MNKTTESLIITVGEAFDVTPAALTSRSQKRYIFEARAAAAWLLRMCYPVLGLVEIGELLGGRDHTTIINALSRVEQRRAVDADYRALLDELRARCKPAQPLSSGAELRRQLRERQVRGGAWWVRQVTPWQPLAA